MLVGASIARRHPGEQSRKGGNRWRLGRGRPQIDAAGGKRIAILATGDPLFYGTARYLCDRLGKDRFEVTPHVSSMQLAFARVKESWDDANLTNLATQPLELVVEKARTAAKVGLFTTEQSPPQAVAQPLLDRKIDYFIAYVCENLGSPDERVTHGELAEIARQEFSPLNVMILVRKPNVPDRPLSMLGRKLFGNPDEMFLQSKPKRGLLTPAEVRAIALSLLDIGPTSTIWDVGNGGSVAIEAAQIADGGRAFAIEMDPDDYALIASNAERFGVRNLTPILGKAPEAWAGLPQPTQSSSAGTGRQVRRIVEMAFEQLRPGGAWWRMSAASKTWQPFVRYSCKGGDPSVLMINLARGNHQLDRLHFESLHPTFLISAVKPTLTLPIESLHEANRPCFCRLRACLLPIACLAQQKPASPRFLPAWSMKRRAARHRRRRSALAGHPRPEKASKAPCIVVIHGGGWRGGNFKQHDSAHSGIPARLCLRDRAVSPRAEGSYPAQIEDVKCAVRFAGQCRQVRHRQGPHRRDRLLGRGASVDVARHDGQSRRPGRRRGQRRSTEQSAGRRRFLVRPSLTQPDFPDVVKNMLNDLVGGKVADKLDVAKSASPITYVDSDDAPMLIYQGTKTSSSPTRRPPSWPTP